MPRFLPSFLCFIGALGIAVPVAIAGPLTPPGPPAPTPGPEPRTALNQINTPGGSFAVFTINQPGSYYLEGNVDVPANQHGIRILADGVTVDLMGFTIDGAGVSWDGVTAGIHDGVTIRNGTILNPGLDGVDTNSARAVRIEDVTVVGAGENGFRIGPQATLENCHARSCTLDGFKAGTSVTVINSTAFNNTDGFDTGITGRLNGCTAENNSQYDFNLGEASVARNCVARGVSTGGFLFRDGGSAYECASEGTFIGFTFSGPSTAVNCVAQDTLLEGFSLSEGRTKLIGCRVSNAGRIGILAAFNQGTRADVHIENCSVRGANGDGIEAGGGTQAYIRNSSVKDATQNGISILRGAVVGCSVSSTGGNGIIATDDARIEDCKVEDAGTSGITVGARSVVRNNVVNDASRNGTNIGAGVLSTGDQNTIDGNTVYFTVFQSRGIERQGAKDLIVRNTVFNANYVNLGTGTVFGPINDLTSPWANFVGI